MDILKRNITKRNRPPEKSIRFPVGTHAKLLKLSVKLGRNQAHLFIEMVDYFHKTQKDPADINDEVLKNTLVKNHDTYIRFIRAQESAILFPMKENVDKMIANQKEIVKYFNERILNANKSLLKNQDFQTTKLSETVKLLQGLHQLLDSKEKLKTKFLFILNEYIRMREDLGAFKNREKEELAANARNQLKAL